MPAEKIEPSSMAPAPVTRPMAQPSAPAAHKPAPAAAPSLRARPSESVERNQAAGAEEDMLDIPAFLRRQAN